MLALVVHNIAREKEKKPQIFMMEPQSASFFEKGCE